MYAIRSYYVDLKDPGADGDDLVGNGGKAGREDRPEIVGVEKGLDLGENSLAEAGDIEEEVAGDQLPEANADAVADYAAEHRADRGDQGKAEGAEGNGDAERQEQHVGRDSYNFV